MNLAQLAIDKNRITSMILITILLMGIVLYLSLSKDSFPPYTVRNANVISVWPGAAPERVELLVTEKVEEKVQELPELKEVTSTSRTGMSIVAVELKESVGPDEMQEVWDKLRRKLQEIDGLPDNVIPFLDDNEIGDVYGIVIGLSSDGFSYEELKSYADDIQDDLISLDDSKRVIIGGDQEERVFIDFDDIRLREFGITVSQLSEIISGTNILSSGGEINVYDERLVLEPTGNFDSIDEIKEMLVPVGDRGDVLSLQDITTINKGYITPAEQIVTVNGRNALSLHVSLKQNANILDLGEEVLALMDRWEERLPVGIEVTYLSRLDIFIQRKINEFIENLIQSVTIVAIVMLIFLGMRTGLIISSLIPIVILTTFFMMGTFTIGINQVSLAALIMALGMMVDNGIVVAETIMVKMEEGIDKKRAAIEACSELFVPLLISTLTTSVAFSAFYLAETIMGDIVGPLFLVISIALISSWLISLTIITFFCYLFLKFKSKDAKPTIVDKVIAWLKNGYQGLILIALKNKVIVLIAIFFTFILAIIGFSTIPFVFMEDSDRNMITADINLLQGTKIERTAEVIDQIDKYIREELWVDGPFEPEKGIVSWSSYIGEGPESYDQGYTPDEANSNYGHILINTTHGDDNQEVINKLDNYCFVNFPDADIKVGALAVGPGSTPIEIRVSGDDPDELAKISESIKLKLLSYPTTKNVKDDWGPKTKKFEIEINQTRARQAGVSNSDIATSLETVLSGVEAGRYREEDESIPINMRSEESQQLSLDDVEALNVYVQSSGQSVPLLQVARVRPVWEYSKIKRFNIDRTITAESELLEGGNATDILTDITPWLDEQKISWPPYYQYEFGGDQKDSAENMGSVAKYLPLAGFVILLLLMLQFNSYRKMTMVALTIPLALTGVAAGLLIFGQNFGFMPFLGVISLAGIIINNAIVLVDRIEIEQNKYERTDKDSVVTACLQRFRPIVLATATTVLGMIPLYIGGGPMWEGLAVVIMIGLLFGTIITLFFIPAFYSLVYKLNYKDFSYSLAEAS
ncbi:MAG: efflux RND transporter permease subunit [Bacteroidota bacterium]